MTFSQAAETCFVKVSRGGYSKFENIYSCQLQLLIIAIETKDEDGTPCIAINPQKVKIKNATVG